MRKILVVIITIVLISSSTPAFAEEGGEKTYSAMGKGEMGKGMIMREMKMMSMMGKMQGMMTEMMGMMKEMPDMQSRKEMIGKLEGMINQCQEMTEEGETMMSEYMKKDTMGEVGSEEHSEMPSSHESHH